MRELTLTVTIDEANLILEGLGDMPFVKVYALIGKIQQQAQARAQANGRNQIGPFPPAAEGESHVG